MKPNSAKVTGGEDAVGGREKFFLLCSALSSLMAEHMPSRTRDIYCMLALCQVVSIILPGLIYRPSIDPV